MFFFGIPFLAAGLAMALSFVPVRSGEGAVERVFAILFPLVFTAVGAGVMGSGVWKLLRRRRACQAQTPGKGASGGLGNADFPFPELRKRIRTAHGRIRLPHSTSPWGTAAGLLVFSVFWNAISWSIAYGIFHEYREKPGESGLLFGLLFIGLFCLVGLGMVYALIKLLLSLVMVGETWVELGAEPVPPGGVVPASLHQAGNFEITHLYISLLCVEEADHGSGKNRRTAREEVRRELMVVRPGAQARNREALVSWELRVPPDAGCSFRSAGNRIRWLVEVKMEIPGRPNVNAKFEFRVGPSQELETNG